METELGGMDDTSVTISSSRACETGRFEDLGWISCGGWHIGKSIQYSVCQLEEMALIVS